jgi:hypothetical protein
MRSTRLSIVALVVLSFVAMLATGALACDKKGAKASTASASCPMKGAKASTASASCSKNVKATTAGTNCPMSGHAKAGVVCEGDQVCAGKCAVSFDTERVSPSELVVSYHGKDTDAVALLHSQANGKVADFHCPLAQKMITAENCTVAMKSIDDGVQFTATSKDEALLDGFAKNYELAANMHATPPKPEKSQEMKEKVQEHTGE